MIVIYVGLFGLKALGIVRREFNILIIIVMMTISIVLSRRHLEGCAERFERVVHRVVVRMSPAMEWHVRLAGGLDRKWTFQELLRPTEYRVSQI
jgi:hypothetical protein